MAEVAVEVPAPLVPAVRDTVVLLLGATAEALGLSLDAQAEGGEPTREAGRHRERLEQLGRALDQLGWPGGEPDRPAAEGGPAQPAALRGAFEVVHDALHGALIDAGERLAVACSASWHSEASEASVRELAAQVIVLDRLVRELEAERRGGR
jgi:hypothetical protein